MSRTNDGEIVMKRRCFGRRFLAFRCLPRLFAQVAFAILADGLFSVIAYMHVDVVSAFNIIQGSYELSEYTHEMVADFSSCCWWHCRLGLSLKTRLRLAAVPGAAAPGQPRLKSRKSGSWNERNPEEIELEVKKQLDILVTKEKSSRSSWSSGGWSCRGPGLSRRVLRLSPRLRRT